MDPLKPFKSPNSLLMRKNAVLIGIATLCTLFFDSCVSYRNTSRVGQVAETKVALVPNVADVEVNFSNRVTGKSSKTWDVDEAKNQAYYQAIVANNIDVLVDPIYEVKSKGRKSTATVTGYAGMYKNVRTIKQENQLVLEQEMKNKQLTVDQSLKNTQLAFDQTMDNLDKKIRELDKFGAVSVVAKEDLKTYLIAIGGGNGNGGGITEKTLNTNPSVVEKFNMLLNSGPPSATPTAAAAPPAPVTPAVAPGIMDSKENPGNKSVSKEVRGHKHGKKK